MTHRPSVHALLAAGALAACSHSPRAARPSPSHVASRGSHASSAYAPPAQPLDRAQLSARVITDRRLSVDELLRAHPVPFRAPVARALGDTDGHERVEQGPFALSPRARERLAAQGYVIAPEREFPNFMAGYFRLYVADQNVYVSADAVLNALHLSFDNLVAEIEEDALAPALQRALTGLRDKLHAPPAGLDAETLADLDLFTAVPLGALTGAAPQPVAGASRDAIATLHAGISSAQGVASVSLYGAERNVDFSQFTPRGHYAGIPARERFFRAVMWLGREGLRLIDSVDGARVLRRRQVRLALALRTLAGPNERAAFTELEQAVAAFAGEPESLTFTDLDALSTRIDRAGGFAAISDAALLQAIDDLRGERPRVASAVLVHPDALVGPVPQPVTFSLAPQRYTPDSRVLSNVSFDRIPARRMMPEALDAAYGALGNDQALPLLRASLTQFDYATELENTHALIDAHDAAYWGGSMYARWMSALRTLSPRDTLAEGAPLPATMSTEAWGVRMLNTQMAAWSEVRHDMVLYAAQSYSGIPGCSYPAAYVDPYPAFWDALNQWVARGQTLIRDARWSTPQRRDRWQQWAVNADATTHHLAEIARTERNGDEPTAEQLAWVNQAMVVHEENVVCTTITTVTGGWLYALFEPRLELGDGRAMVADVHTQPADENGNPVGRVLHIGTGNPRLMAVVAGGEEHPRVYLGLASNYLERTTEHFERLTDERWRAELAQASQPAWLGPAVAR